MVATLFFGQHRFWQRFVWANLAGFARLGLVLTLALGLALALASCKGGSKGKVTDNSPRLKLTETALSASDITTSSFNLTWEAATGGAEPLTYKVYTSKTSKLETTKQIANQGRLQAQVAAASASVTGLRQGTKYYFNVQVTDADGATRIYAATHLTTADTDSFAPTSPSITIEDGAATHNSATVSVTLSAIDDTAVRGYYLSTSSTAPSASAADWVTIRGGTDYSAAVSYSFSDTSNGSKALYAWFKDATGNVSSSASDSIGIFFDWTQEAYLKPDNTGSGDYFGGSVALNGDLLVVGAKDEDSSQTTITTSPSADNSAASAGAAYVFVRSNGSWAAEAYLKAPNAEAADNFGYAVALSGSTLAVGAQGESSSQTTITNGATASSDNSTSASGAVYVFLRSGTTWTQQAYLKAPNSNSNDYFGSSLALDGDTLVVGAWSENSSQTTITNGTTASSDTSATDAGAAYVFLRSGTSWAQQAYLKAPNAEASDLFGSKVALDGDTILATSRWEDSSQTSITNSTSVTDDDNALSAGAVYVFVRSSTTWSHQAYLKAPNTEASDNFGQSAALSGDTAVVGADSEDSSQTTITNGTTASSDNSAADSGAAYVFVRSGTTWTQEAYLKAPNAEASDGFGFEVAISGDLIAVSATGEDSAQTIITNGTTASSNNSAAASGAVYVFARDSDAWTQKAYLKATNTEAADYFGWSLALDDDSLAISAPYEDSSQTGITNEAWATADNSAGDSGALYLFTAEP